MDLVIREDVIDAVENISPRFTQLKKGKEYQFIDKKKAKAAIKKLPAFSVVTCQDCKYAKNWFGTRVCFLWRETGVAVDADGYCHHGSRPE